MDEIDLKSVKFAVDIQDNKQYFIYSPPRPSWRCKITPQLYCDVIEGHQPNVFHRMMQRLCFGVKWSRIKDDYE